MVARKPVFVTQPHLPPLEEFVPYLERIWNAKILTNGGPFHQELERALCDYLNVEYICLFANGTLALMTALRALQITGEVITTPFTFVATAHSILLSELKPVFVDVEPRNLNLDATKIEAAITTQTSAILAVHCFGHPCNVEALESIAQKHGLKIIYDAAHTFGAKFNCKSLANFGDLSVLSFHATKVFNTFEGGAIICHDLETKQRIDQLKNFGHSGEESVPLVGSNGKMNEFSSALGLLQLKYVDKAIQARRLIDQTYRQRLANVRGIHCLEPAPQEVPNFAYFPILVSDHYRISRDELNQVLRSNNIYPRKYFFPLVSNFPMYHGLHSSRLENVLVASKAASEVLCLPIYPQLELATVEHICALIAGD